MSLSQPEAICGSVASLHLHPIVGGAPLESAASIEVVEEMGIRGEARYFGRRSLNGEASTLPFWVWKWISREPG